jgi:uncharacterized RDD family membrane protein YckC
MKPAARKAYFFVLLLPAVVWLALCIAPEFALRRARGAAAATVSATVAAAAPAPTTAPATLRATTRDLLAYGTDERFWSADVIPVIQGKANATKTFLRVRGPGDSQWQSVGELEAAAISLAHRGTELLVVLDDGDWKIVSDSGARSGIPLPGHDDVLALAGDGDDVWAVGVGLVEAPSPALSTASTAPVTSASPTTTSSSPPPSMSPGAAAAAAILASTTAPVPEQVSLFQLTRGDWTRRDALPAGLDRADLRVVSLAILDRKLMLAIVDSDGVVRLFTHKPDGGWDNGQELAVAAAGHTRLRLLNLRGKPALWVSDPIGPGALFIAGSSGSAGGAGGRWQGPVRLAPSPRLANFDRTSLATALGQLRLLASDGKQRFAEQLYNEDGSPSGQATEAVTEPSPLDNRVTKLIQMFVVAVLFIWMMGALRQRPDSQEAAKRLDQLHLAPIGRRLLGGAIDLLPILICTYVAAQLSPPADATGSSATELALTYDSPQFAWITAGIAIYLLHTTAFELLFARSAGKFATGTRVAALSGARPSALAILTRNLLRIVDIVLLFPPIFVFFSPLRQRVGDMAAGTLVVMNGATARDSTGAGQDDDDASKPANPPER